MKTIYIGNIPLEAVEPILKCYKKMLVEAIDNKRFEEANEHLWKMQSLWNEYTEEAEQNV